MKQFEDALREALRRQEPPAGFAERVMACLGNPAPERPPTLRQRLTALFRPARLGLAAVAACILLVVGVEYQRQQRTRTETARRQVIVALRVTSEALESVREQVGRSSSARQVINISHGILTASKEKL